jgi:REP element-mobilizing transposase RayT
MYWYRRLPHWVPEDTAVFVTWRLAGSSAPPAPATGPQWLAHPRIAAIFVEALLHGESVRRSYDLFALVVMPNHVHVVVQPFVPLQEIMRWLKAATANRANALLNRTGTAFWRREYFDRWIRTEKQLSSTIAYVEANPVRSGLSDSPEEWQWSSAHKTPAARPPALQIPP